MYYQVKQNEQLLFSANFRQRYEEFLKDETNSPRAHAYALGLTKKVTDMLNEKTSKLFSSSDPNQSNLRQAVAFMDTTFKKIELPPEIIIGLNQINDALNHQTNSIAMKMLHKNNSEALEFHQNMTDQNKEEMIQAAIIRSFVHREIKITFLTIYREANQITDKNSKITLVEDAVTTILPSYSTDNPVQSAVLFACNAIYRLCHFIEDLQRNASNSHVPLTNVFQGTEKVERELLKAFRSFSEAEINAQF